MHAAWAPVTAADCVIQAQGSVEVAVGSTSSFELRIAHTQKLARRFDGCEDVTAILSGAALTTEHERSLLKLNDSHWSAYLCMVEASLLSGLQHQGEAYLPGYCLMTDSTGDLQKIQSMICMFAIFLACNAQLLVCSS